MKKIISLIMSMCLVITGLPLMVYAKNSTPEISLEEFTKRLRELQAEHDGNYVSEIIIEDGKEFYHVDGEEYPVSNDLETTATVTDNDFAIPLSAIELYADISNVSTYSVAENSEEITVDKETAEALGFHVQIEEDKAVLTQPYQTERLIVSSKYDIDPLDSVAIVEGYNNLHIVQFDNQESAKQAEEYYNNQRRIEFAEPDLVMSTMEYEDSSNDSLVNYGINDYGYHLSWGSEFVGVDDYIDYIGDRDNLPEIVVGIIDTGIDVDHEFLEDRIIRTYYNISLSGAENDENDDKGHGTHVAGIIADNTLDNVKIKGYKVLDSGGYGTLSEVIIAFDYAVADSVKIINMSLGVEGTSKAFERSINAATKAGVIVCVSAGNNGHDASRNCPANIESCITVGACEAGPTPNTVAVPYWTSYGSLVDLFAPGLSIYSTYLDNGYQTLSGTSMACPFVAASVALLLSKDISLNADGVCDLLQENGKTFFWHSITNYILYIATITEYNQYRTEKPIFSLESGRYSDSITVELSCPEENAEIYYTLDGTRASKANGILYTEPIVIDKVTKVHAAAYAGDKLKSLQAIANYYITVTDPEGNFEIDTNGLITAYNGTNQYLTIPNTINGITVTGIGTNAFKGKDMVMIKFPDTLTYVEKSAFSGKSTLQSVYCNNLKEVGERAFYGCRALDTIDLTQLETVGEYTFFRCISIQSVYNEKLTRIEKFAFNGLTSAIGIDFPNVEYVAHSGLADLLNAEYIHLPNVKTLSTGSLRGAVLVESLDFPELTTIGATSGGGGCFESTHNLKEFNAPKLTGTLPKRTFYGSRLEMVELPNITSLAEEAFYFSWLKTIRLPKVTTIGERAFDDCSELEELYIPLVTTLPKFSLRNTKSLKMLLAPSVTQIEENAFLNSSLARIEMSSVQSIADLPDTQNCIIAMPSTFKECTENTEGRNYIVYGTEDTDAEIWAKANGHEFFVISQKTALLQDVPLEYTGAEMLTVDVIGFNLKYQWYSNTEDNNKTGKPIDGATDKEFNPADYPAPYYYCVITSTDEGHDSVEIRTGEKTDSEAILNPMSSQIRFQSNTDGSYANKFDVRSRAKITDEDFAKYIAETNEEAVKKITKVGFVYARDSINFSIDDAQKVAQGEAVNDYVDAPVNYIQDADGYYMFTCIIMDIPFEDVDKGFIAYAYICVEDKWYFYKAETTTYFKGLYDTWYPQAADAYGW